MQDGGPVTMPVFFLFVELFYTEKSHVRNLKLLDLLFHTPMSHSEFCSKELVDLVFPDIKPLIKIHVTLNDAMKEYMKENKVVQIKDVAQILLETVSWSLVFFFSHRRTDNFEADWEILRTVKTLQFTLWSRLVSVFIKDSWPL